MISIKTPPKIACDLATRVRERRLRRGWTQSELAGRAGIKPGTYVVFERTGRISLLRLVKLFEVLGLSAQIEQLGAGEDYSQKTLADITRPTRQRGRRRAK